MPGNWGLTRIVRLLYPCSFSNLCYGYVAFWTKRVDALRCGCDGFEIETLINVRALKSRPKMSKWPVSKHHGSPAPAICVPFPTEFVLQKRFCANDSRRPSRLSRMAYP